MRRRYYGNNFKSVPYMPLACPEAYTPSEEEMAAVDNDTLYDDGVGYNYWFKKPSDLLSHNFGTEDSPEYLIDVNIIEEFNKRRPQRATFVYSCIPGNISGYESYIHPFTGLADAVVYETINGKRKKTTIPVDSSDNIFYNEYIDKKYARVLYIGDQLSPFRGRLYSMDIISRESDVKDIKLRVDDKGIFDEVSGKRFGTFSVVYDNEAVEYYATINSILNTGLRLPKRYSLCLRFSVSEYSKDYVLYYSGESISYDTGNYDKVKFFPKSGTASVLSTRASSGETANDNIWGIYKLNSIITLNLVVDPFGEDDQQRSVSYTTTEDKYYTSSTIKSNLGRIKYHTFERGSTQRMVYIKNARYSSPARNAVWLFTGSTELTKDWNMTQNNTIRVVHRNPDVVLNIDSTGVASTNITGSILMKRINDKIGGLGSCAKITKFYAYDDSIYGGETNDITRAIYTGYSTIFWYINTRRLLLPISGRGLEGYDLLIGPNGGYNDTDRRGYYWDEVNYSKGEEKALYYRNDSENEHFFVLHKFTQYGVYDEESGCYKYRFLDGCTAAARNIAASIKNVPMHPWILELNDITFIGDYALYETNPNFAGTNYNSGTKKCELVIDSNLTAGSFFHGAGTLNEIDLVRFTNSKGYGDGKYNINYLSASSVAGNADVEIPRFLAFSDSSVPFNQMKGNFYIDSRYFVPRTSCNTGLSYVSEYALKTESNPAGTYIIEPNESLKSITYNGKSYYYGDVLYFNNGSTKRFIQLDPNATIKYLKIPAEYKAQPQNAFFNSLGFWSNSNLRVLDLSDTQWVQVNSLCNYWENGGYLILPKTATTPAAPIGGENTAKNGENGSDNKKLHIFLTWDSVSSIRNAFHVIAGSTTLTKGRVIVHIPQGTVTDTSTGENISLPDAYKSKGWNDSMYYRVEEYNPSELDTIISNYLTAIENE